MAIGNAITLTLPLPPSKNRLHAPATRYTTDKRTGKRRAYQGQRNSDEYAAFLETVGWEVLRQTTPEQREGLKGHLLEIHVCAVFPPGDERSDLANILDSLCDSLKGPLGVDDRNFWLLHLAREESGEVGVRVTVEVAGRSARKGRGDR